MLRSEDNRYKAAREILRPVEKEGIETHKYQQLADNIAEGLRIAYYRGKENRDVVKIRC